MAPSQATEQEAHAVNQKEGFKKPRPPKENGKGSKRSVPLTLKERLKEELVHFEKANVIKREKEPTDWVSSLVTEKPNSKLRVCIDPKHLNKALKRSHYPLSVIEDILLEQADVKVFSKADLKDGFSQIQLDEESSKLTTFQNPWDRYRYLRMPFQISPSPECFSKSWTRIWKVLKETTW